MKVKDFFLIIFMIFYFVGFVLISTSCSCKNHILIIDSENNVLYHGSYSHYWFNDLGVRIRYKGIVYNFTCTNYIIYEGKKCILCGDRE